MIRNYFVVAFRNLYRNSFYSIINIAGLGTGIACSILILLWVADELSFDQFHNNYNTLYKVGITDEYNGEVLTQFNVPNPLRDGIKTKTNSVTQVAITNHGEGNLLGVGDKHLNKMGISVSEEFLTMFNFQVIRGDQSNKNLVDPNSIVITEGTAKSLFGDEDPIGKFIRVDNRDDLKVTAVLQDVPAQSSFQFDFLLPFSLLESNYGWAKESRTNWRNNSFLMYAQTTPGAVEEEVNASIANLIQQNAPDRDGSTVFLHPMSKWRLYSSFANGKVSGGMIDYVRAFTGIAIFILVIACINFMNLATARSEKRAREVGIRKSIGSNRKQLVFQFLGESILITLIAFALALMIVELTLTPYNLLVNKHLAIPYTNPTLWVMSISMVVLTGIIAGSYPAFYLSGFQPAKVLKGKVASARGTSSPRKVLVTLQFGFSIFLIIGTMVIYQQIMHVKDRETGYDRENLLLIWTNTEVESTYTSIKAELKNTGVVKSVAKSSAPVTRIFTSADVEWPGKDPNTKVGFVTVATEYDYTETLGIPLLEGRDFSESFPSDSSAVIINQAAADLIGFKEPIGSKIKMWGDERTIIGVTENVVMGSPYAPVDPTAVVLIPDWSSTINVRLKKTADLQASIEKVQEVFKKLSPSFPMWYRFADDEFNTKFSGITLIARLASIFSSLAIFITCLGLFGLAAFTAEQRRKELGIRKVMGATVTDLIVLISKDFSRLIIAAFIISAPLAWWGLNNYLEQYPYRIDIAWWILPLAGLASLAIGMIIVATHAFRAAQSNPVDSLRSE